LLYTAILSVTQYFLYSDDANFYKENIKYFNTFIFVNNYIIEQFRRKKYSYLITNHRLIFIKNNSFESLILDNIKQISFEEHPFKYICGSVIIGELETIFGSNNESFKWKYLLNYKSGINFKSNKYSFDFIKDYKEVKLLLENEILKNKSKI
jgi:hypothetical protein